MRHVIPLTQVRAPEQAQFESILQLVGLLQSLLSLFTNIANTFGISIPQKGEG